RGLCRTPSLATRPRSATAPPGRAAWRGLCRTPDLGSTLAKPRLHQGAQPSRGLCRAAGSGYTLAKRPGSAGARSVGGLGGPFEAPHLKKVRLTGGCRLGIPKCRDRLFLPGTLRERSSRRRGGRRRYRRGRLERVRGRDRLRGLSRRGRGCGGGGQRFVARRCHPMKDHDQVVSALNDVLTAELTAVNQYFVHARMCENWGYERRWKKIRAESIGEMKHADSLIERILYLEGIPN